MSRLDRDLPDEPLHHSVPEKAVLSSTTAKLLRSEHESRRIIDNLVDTYLCSDVDGRLVVASRSVYELLGWTHDELLGRPVAELYLDPRGRGYFLDALHANGGKIIGYETVLKRKDGSEVWVESSAHYVRDDAGNIVGVEGTVRDTTARRRTETALRESEERFRRLQALSSAGIAIHENGLLIDVNVALARLTGYSVGELIGMDGLLLVAPDYREVVREKIRGDDEKPYTVVGMRKDGSTFPAEVRGRNIPYHGRTVRVAEYQDISERHAAEKEREQLQLQIQQAQKMEAIGQLTGGIAHDFNNIMTAILGYAKLARAFHVPDSDAKLAEFLDQVIRSGERAANLVSQMLAFSRGGAYTEMQPVAPAMLLDEVLKMLRPTLPSTLAIARATDDAVTPVLVDPMQLHQVLTNLIINARDAMGERGTLQLAVRHKHCKDTHCASCHGDVSGEWAGLEVADDGPGMTAATRSEIFRPFFTTKEVGKGTGMGLSVAHGIVHRMGGHILVDTAPGRGATFTILLPTTSNADVREPAAPARDDVANATRLAGIRVLVVDDEAMLCGFYCEALQAHGCIVTAHSEPQTALRVFECDPDAFDLVLCDQTMPELTGVDVLHRVLQLRPQLPLIICTGYSAHLDADKAEQLGAAAFLPKPVEMDALLATMARVLSSCNTPIATTRRAGQA